MSLVSSIVATMLALFAVESAAFYAICRSYGLETGFFLIFLAAQAGFHTLIVLLLMYKKEFFYNVRSGVPEKTVNLCNQVTLFRITMLPFLLFLIFASQKIPVGLALVISTALTFLSDFVDGRLARTKNMETYMGKILDSASDYLLLGTTTGGFFLFARLKTWLFALIAGRLCINALGMLILSLIRKRLSPQTTFFGKVAIAAIMVLLVLESGALMLGPPVWMVYVELAAGITIGLSVIDKIVYFASELKNR